ncbi:MAG: hypothetical protein V3U33_08150 [candidate division NC10 bacterium]
MSLWSLLSAAAVFAAGLPAIYFLIAMRNRSRVAVRLMALFVASIVAHTLFHLFEGLAGESIVGLGLEVGSAALVLGFALVYWPLRRGRR